MTEANLERVLATNRAEEIGYDVWKEFVLPPFYKNLSLGDTRKPQAIIGGRGCGKTMLLRFLSHESTFSPSRPHIPDDALSHVGLYWRADTQFASLMQLRETPDDIWESAFRHLSAIVLSLEILRSLESIARSSLGALSPKTIEALEFKDPYPLSENVPTTYSDFRAFLEARLSEFEEWVNDVRTASKPRFLPGDRFLRRMIARIQTQIPSLRCAVFFVYIDEFENLAMYQQRIINTWLKHSEPPLIFNVAMKRNGFKTRHTEGEETLSFIHDFRVVDLEAFDTIEDFQIFAAEILLLRLRLADVVISDIEPEILRDPSKLRARRNPDYISRTLSAMKRLFPSLSQRELAQLALSNSNIRDRLEQRIEKALKRRGSRLSAKNFLRPDFPEASVISPALLNRDSVAVADICNEWEFLIGGKPNKFTGPTNWIHNNFIGCFLQLYDGLGRPCPLYGGFSTYCFMSRGNLRHFLELCRKALERIDNRSACCIEEVPVEIQAEAARQVSADLLAEVRSFGPKGNNLHTFLLRVGSLFSLSQESPTQSEPERTHFAIQGGETGLPTVESDFLAEAIKWSVLFEEKGTKKKNVADPEGGEYVLNPIYAPYFHISYRKRRKLDLPAGDASTLISGTYEDVRSLLKKYQRQWSVELTGAALPLFAHLDEGGQ